MSIPSGYSYKLISPESLSHPNMLENLYFQNEMMKAQIEFNGFNGRLKEEKHELNFLKNDEEKPFWGPVLEKKTFKEDYSFQNLLLENRTNKIIKVPPIKFNLKIDTHNWTLSSNKSLSSRVDFSYNGMNISIPANYEYKNSWGKIEEKQENSPLQDLEPNYRICTKLSIEKKITYSQRFLYIPLENDKILQTVIDSSGKKHSFTPVNYMILLVLARKQLVIT